MKGAVFTGDRRVEIIEMPKPTPGQGEVLVQIKASTLCGSDLKYYRAPSDTVTEKQRTTVRGHEPCGIVVELGPSARGVRVGDRVMIHHYKGCGECKYCRSGWTQLCARGGVIGYGYAGHGGHQEFGVFPDYTCVQMPDGLSYEEGASCACGTGTAYQALQRLKPSGMDTFAVFGQGPVGISAVLLGKTMGARVIGIDTVPERLELAKVIGADEVINAAEVDPVEVIKDLTGGEGADCAIDCTGVDVARVNMLKCCRIWGRACFVGEGGTVTFEPSPLVIHKHLTVYGSWTFSTHILAEVARFIVDKKVPLKDTITHRFPLEQTGEAYRLFEGGKTGKIAVLP